MSLLVPCSACGSRQKGKNAWLCWAWNRADNVRVAYKQRLCLQCFLTSAMPLIGASEDEMLNCPACHSDSSEQLDPIYLTYIVPGSPEEQAELATCAPCAAAVRIRAQLGAELMPDRGVGAASSAPTRSPTTGWDELGLRPRP